MFVNPGTSNREAPNRKQLGDRKYKERIDRDSRSSKDLPFSFSKPAKPAPTSVTTWCPTCDKHFRVTRNTICVECKDCASLFSVTEENSER